MSDTVQREPDLVFEEEVVKDSTPQGPPGSYFDKDGLLVHPDTGLKDEDFVSEEELEKEKASVTPPSPEGPSRDELIEEQKKLQARYEAETRRGDEVTALREGIQGLSETLSRQNIPSPVQQVGESDEAFRTRINDNFIEDPAKALNEVWTKKAEPFMKKQIAQNMYWSRAFAEQKHKDTFGQYAGEIDKAAQNLNPEDPQIYEKAHNMVLASHMGEIEKSMEERIRAKIASEQEAAITPSPGIAPKPTTPAYQAGPAPKGTSGTRVKYNNSQKVKAEQIALAKYGGVTEWKRIISTANNMVKGGRAEDMDDAIRRLT